MSEIKCEECGKCFANKYTLKTHTKTHISRDRNFICQVKNCGRKFFTQHHLDSHIATVHECEERKFLCKICNKTFKTQNNLQTHEVVHNDEKSFLCRFCDKTFIRSQDVKVHENIHKDEKSYKCKQCEREFNQQSNLIEHVKRAR